MFFNVLKENIKNLYQKGDLARALLLAEECLKKYPKDIWFHALVGELLKNIMRSENPLQILSIIRENEDAYSSRLILARILESDNDSEKSFREYIRALKSANSQGFWLDDDSTPAWCRQLVIHAINYVEKYRKDIINTWLEALYSKFGKNELDRVSRGIRMYSGEIPTVYDDPRQKPGFLYIPGLPVKPVFERKDLDFIDYYEAQFDKIKAELDNLILHNVHIENYCDTDKHGLTKGGDWDAKFFFRHGKRYDDTHALCPQTSEILTCLPLVHIQDHSPEVCFSVLRPGAHLLPHRGITNSRSVLHMGLQIPSDCALNVVGIEELHWQPGKVFAFDDNYLHEAWNRSDESRYVLLADIWNPFLTDAECQAITDFVTKVGELNSRY